MKKIITYIILLVLFWVSVTTPFVSQLKNGENDGGALYIAIHNFSWLISVIVVIATVIIFSKKNYLHGALIGASMLLLLTLVSFISCLLGAICEGALPVVFGVLVIAAFIIGLPIAFVSNKLMNRKQGI